MSDTFVYLNGTIIPHDDARISVFDIGLLRGLGIYEAMGVWNGSIFKFQEHMDRFRRSAGGIGIDVPESNERIKEIIFELLEKNYTKEKDGEFPRANIKFILTGGQTVGSIDYDPSHPTFCIFTEDWHALPEKLYTHGASIITYEHTRHFAEYKTTDYITAVQLQKTMRAAGAIEALYTKDGMVYECTTSNFFIVSGGILITPLQNVLPGITRLAVIEVAHKHGLTVEERSVSLIETYAADEVFATSSFKDILPIVRINEKIIGDGNVGPLTKELMSLFKDFAGL